MTMLDAEALEALAAAREHAARSYRPHDWRVPELLEGRWDHHPDVSELLTHALASQARAREGVGNG